MASFFEGPLWSNPLGWPENFATISPTGERDLFTFLAHAIEEVAAFASRDAGRDERMLWSARQIVARCANGSLRAVVTSHAVGDYIELHPAHWRTAGDDAGLRGILSDCSTPDDDGRRHWIFVSKFGLLRLIQRIQAQLPQVSSAPSNWQIEPGERINAWILRAEVRAEAERRAGPDNITALAKAYADMALPERKTTWESIRSAINKTQLFRTQNTKLRT